VAGLAGDGHMCAGQRKAGRRVIEGSTAPTRRAMARLTGQRETGLDVVRVGGLVVVRHVAGFAGRIVQRVVVVHVAGLAGDGHMCAGQRKAGRRVIEGSTAPTRRAVARLASCRKTGRYVAGAVRVVVVRFMASIAVRW